VKVLVAKILYMCQRPMTERLVCDRPMRDNPMCGRPMC